MYGFTSCGQVSTGDTGLTERFDDILNIHIIRADATPRRGPTGYSMYINDENVGFTSGGIRAGVVGTTEKFSDITNTHTSRKDIIGRRGLAGYSIYQYGFACGGVLGSNLSTDMIERFDDMTNTHIQISGKMTARGRLCGYSMPTSGFWYGFTSCGNTDIIAWTGITERYDNIGDISTLRATASARRELTGYSMIVNNEYYGFSCGGWTNNQTERFDDNSNTHTTRTTITPAGPRNEVVSFSMKVDNHWYGFAGCGWTGTGSIRTGQIERFDDNTNTQTIRNPATIKSFLAGYALDLCPTTICDFVVQ